MLAETAWLDAERRRLVGLCTRITGDRDAAEDLAQETLLEAWRNEHKLRDPAGAERWLNAIARNVCLRWARRRGRDAALLADAGFEAAAELAEEVGPHELDEVLDGALALVAPATRDALLRHHVHGWSHAEIAAREGISEDAVAMRMSRGRRTLRRLLAGELGADFAEGWRETRVWCSTCGSRRLDMLRDDTRVAFRCRACAPEETAAYSLANPAFAEVVGERVRPTAILRRAADWSSEYFGGGAGDAPCTGCRRPIRLRRFSGRRRGLHGACRRCDEEVWSSVEGLAHSRREARAFRSRHGRVLTMPARDLEFRGIEATLVRLEAARGRAALDVVLARDTLRVLAVL